MSNTEKAEPYASGSDMWRDNVDKYGIITARVISHNYLNMQSQNPDSQEQQFCAELRHAMSLAPNSIHIKPYLWNELVAELDDETEMYNASMRAFKQCAEHVDEAIHATVFGDGPKDCHYNLALDALIDQHGLERVEIVLKCAALDFYYFPFTKYSDPTYTWARDFKRPDHFGNFGIRTRPSTLVGLVDELRAREPVIKTEHPLHQSKNAPKSVISKKAKILTVSELASKHRRKNPGSLYFSNKTLEWFGEKLEDMRLLDDTVKIKTSTNEIRECYVLVRLQRKHPDGRMRTQAYFDIETLRNVLPHPSLLSELKTGLDFWLEDKPSVLNEIREARTAPKVPSGQKLETDKSKKKNQPEH